MVEQKNVFSRALSAIIAGREREAARYIACFEREYSPMNGKLTKR